ncbi:TetR/AcrR family transcriptional regulator [Brevibacterium sp. 2SA]|uniref:TetR/AcrR family transcriptional regulator n=1 Tax=Brevibacterium sp. 2SA TaxID=2502198 RepID=UPI0010F8BD74|nr:TetR/AcrR family transcriptional regulator [Brevibacterium sp. 2SA]
MSDTALARMAPGKRDALIAAAAHEFASHAASQASLNRIIAACGMSKSSFYHAFDSKDELLGLVVSTLVDRARDDWSPPSPKDFAPDFWATASATWDEAMRVWPSSEALDLLWRIVWTDPQHPALRDFHRAIDHWLDEVLIVGRRTGAVDAAVSPRLQTMAVTTLLRAFDEWTLRTTVPAPRDGTGALSDDDPAEAAQTADSTFSAQAGAGPDETRAGAIARLGAEQFHLLRRLIAAADD